jgi:YVTN family beta-propeller protein
VCSCVKDKPQEPVSASISISSDNTVFVINEGPFQSGHGSISVFDPNSNSIVEDYYYQQNNSYLGNIVQSVTKYNNNYYIVNNNSNSITVVNASDFVKTATINEFNSPRYMLPITYSKAYVSDIYANAISIVNLNSNTIISNIPCLAGTEEMTMIYNKAFVTNSNSNYCYVINTSTDLITDSINVGKGASSITIDKNAKIWVLASGTSTVGQTGKLVRIDPITLQIEQSLNFSSGNNPYKLCINKTRDTLYYINNGVYQFSISANTLPSSALINQGSKVYYGLGINPKDYSIYVADAIDYVQKSKIEIYKPNGTFINSFNAGIISNGFIFE